MGKELNFDDPRSKLFFVFVEILEHLKKENPNVKFLLENVRMKNEWRDVISGILGVQPILIDSALLSAQTRRRYYWTNIEGVIQPQDKNIKMLDILEKRVDDRWYLSDKMKKYAFSTDTKNFRNNPEIDLVKARTLTTAGLKRAGTTNYVSDFYTNGGSKDRIRQLTPVEEERLQTLPDSYTEGVSNTQRRKCIGNGWTVDVIAHIFSFLGESPK